jgi:hypothetical protein
LAAVCPLHQPNRRRARLAIGAAMRVILVAAIVRAAPVEAQAFPELGPAPLAPDMAKLDQGQRIRSAALNSAGGWLDTSNRSTVRSTYLSAIEGTAATPIGWTGSINGCVPGDTDASFKAAVLQRINWFRGMAGVPAGVTLDPALGVKDAGAALMMSANRSLNHFPPATWTCYTAAGAEAAAKSNICIWTGTIDDPGCVELYMRDHGASNAVVGHRRWLLYPQTVTMGTGDVRQSFLNGITHPTANATWVVPPSLGSPRPATRDDFVAWPPKGYVPYQVVVPRWSFSYPGASFTSATVTMTRAGSPIPAVKLTPENGYGENTLVWVVNNLDPDNFQANWAKPTGDETVRVTLSNVIVGGTPRTFTYDVIIFDPAAGSPCSYSLVPPSPVSVSASGASGVGFLLQTVSGCTWTVTSPVPWITITGGASGNGPGSAAFTVAANPGPGTRSATLTAAGLPYVVNQAAPAVPPPNSPPVVTSLAPGSGSGVTQVFAMTVSDPDGAADLNVLNLLVNYGIDGQSACYLAYTRSANLLSLVNDAGTALVGSVTAGAVGSVSNSACTINGATSSASASGNALALSVSLTFNQSAFSGSRVVYAAARDSTTGNSGWIPRGVWTVPSAPLGPTRAVTYLPASGSGNTATVTATFRHTTAASNITNAQILINHDLNGSRACYLTWVRAWNAIYLVADSGPTAPLIGPLTPNSGTGSVQNSQCRVSSATLTDGGTDVSLGVTVEYIGGMRGNVIAFIAAQRYSAAGTLLENSGWNAMGLWNVP